MVAPTVTVLVAVALAVGVSVPLALAQQPDAQRRQHASGDADVAGPAAGRIAEVDVGRRGREYRRAVEGGVGADAVDFSLDRRELGIQRRTLGWTRCRWPIRSPA